MNFSNLAFFFTHSQLQCHSFQQWYENAQSAFTHGHLREAEMNLTIAADAITHTLSMVLLNRAVVRGIQGNIETGLADAYKIINMNPTLPKAYLCAGALLRSDQKLTDALRLYKTGLQKITIDKKSGDIIHPKVLQLRQVLNELQLEINSINADIFNKLPNEVLASIVALLPYRDRLMCAATCHTWRSQLFDHLPGIMWHNLGFDFSTDLETLDLQLAHIHRHTDHVREIYLSARCDQQMSFRVLQFLTKCSRIEKLDIRVDINDDSNMDTRSAFYQVLKNNQQSLRKVTVRSSVPCVVIGIINSCPLLYELTFDSTGFYSMEPRTRTRRGQRAPTITLSDIQQQRENSEADDGLEEAFTDNDKLEILRSGPEPAFLTSSFQPGFNITRLELMNTLLDSLLPELFWKQFPSIQHIIVRISFIGNLPGLAKAILKYCPDIKTLDLGPPLNKERRSLDMSPIDITPLPTISNYFTSQQPLLLSSKTNQTEKGLVTFNLLVQTMVTFGFDDGLSNLIYNNRNTIETFHIRPRIIYGRVEDEDNHNTQLVLPSMVTQQLYMLSNLRDLGFHGHHFDDLTQTGIDIGIIIRNCPMIESLTLDEISIRNDEMYQITLYANHLRRFRLVLSQPHDHYTVASMKHFLNNTQAQLEDIYLDGSNTLDDEALKILGTKHQSHLKSFALLNCSTVTIEGLNVFATAIAAHGNNLGQLLYNSTSNQHDRRSKLRHLTLYHLSNDIETQQCFDQVLKPLIDVTEDVVHHTTKTDDARTTFVPSLQSFSWVTELSPPEDSNQLLNSLKQLTCNIKCDGRTTATTEPTGLKICTLFGTKEYWEYTFKPGMDITSKYTDNISLSKLRHTL